MGLTDDIFLGQGRPQRRLRDAVGSGERRLRDAVGLRLASAANHRLPAAVA